MNHFQEIITLSIKSFIKYMKYKIDCFDYSQSNIIFKCYDINTINSKQKSIQMKINVID